MRAEQFQHIAKFELITKPHSFHLLSTVVSILVLTIGVSGPAQSQPRVLESGYPTLRGLDSGIHPESPTRTKVDLSGEWQYSTDDETWYSVRLPASVDYVGRMVFRRRVTVGDSLLAASSFKFVAFGVNYECEVYVNDIFAGRHIGGYTSFEFEIPDDALQVGSENTVKVVVSNTLTGRTTLPLRKQIWGWRNYGGIFRDVFLVATPRTWIDRLAVQTVLDPATGSGSVHVKAVLADRKNAQPDSLESDLSGGVVLSVELVDRFTGSIVAQAATEPLQLAPNKNFAADLSLPVENPKLWSPNKPELYLVRAALLASEGKRRTLVDETSQIVGFSSVRVEQSALLVNGVETVLKGVVWQEDIPLNGASLSYEQMEKDVVLIKSLGANAVRFAFRPPHPYMLNLCARYGLYALVEIPVWNVSTDILSDEAFRTLAESILRETVDRDQSNPAVIAWGVGSEFDSADDRAAEFVRRMRAFVHTLDLRPVYYGSSMMMNDACASAADLTGMIVPAVELKTFRRYLSDWKKTHPQQPLWVLGYGKEVDHENRNGYSDPMSQEAQARYFLQYYGAIKEAGAAGSFISAFSDWRGDRPVLTVDVTDRTVYPMGLVSAKREKRLAYEMVRALYNEEKISALPAGMHRPGFAIAHVLTGLFVILLVGYHYSYNRRFSESLKRALLRSYNFFADLRDLHTVSVLHTLLLASAISITFAGLCSSVLYHYRADRLFDYVLTFFVLSDVIKEEIIWVTWHPFGGIVVLTGLFFVAGLLVALLLRIVSLVLRAKATWFHVYSVSVWGASPVVILSPLAMSLFKIMENPLYIIPSFAVIAVFLVWTFLRVLKGISVVFETNSFRTFLGGSAFFLLVCGGLGGYYDSAYALSSYVSMVLHLMRNLG